MNGANAGLRGEIFSIILLYIISHVAGLPTPFNAVRYHSLAGTEDTLPQCLEVRQGVLGTQCSLNIAMWLTFAVEA